MAENNCIDVPERKLYHGTGQAAVGIIAEKGFDWRLCGKNAIVYGQGKIVNFVPYTFCEK